MSTEIHEQLHDAWKASGLTLDQLSEEIRALRLRRPVNESARRGKQAPKRRIVDVSAPSLSRKLRGEQVITVDEIQAIARVLGVTVKWSGRAA